MSQDASAALNTALVAILPHVADLDVMLANEDWRRKHVPLEGDRLAAPFEFTWRDGVLDEAKFEIYDQDTPLGTVSARIYAAFLQRPEAATVRRLEIGNVACKEFSNSQLLGDAIGLLARSGLPAHLERLELERIGPVTNAGDLGFYATNRLTRLLPKLGNIQELVISGCEGLGKMDLPQLRSLRLHSGVSAKNLMELARARLPALERLELACDIFSDIELRFKAARALLRSRRLPRLSYLALENLDLDEDQRLELDEDEEAEAEPDSWVDMIADSPLLKQLQGLELSFQDYERELARLVDRADDFRHLARFEFWGAKGPARLEFPTRESIREALGA